MPASLAVEAPERAAAALIALTHAVPATFYSGRRPPMLVELPVTTPLGVEQVIEIACRTGFHAEQIRTGVLELWIDEWVVLEVVTPEADAQDRTTLLAA